MDGVLSVWREAPDDPLERLDYDPERVFRYHLSGRSLSNVTTYRRELEKFHGDDLDWGRLLHEAIRQGEREYVEGIASVDPWPDESRPAREMLVEGVFPLNRVSCVFGMGESAKSLGTEAMMADVSQGRASVGRVTMPRNVLWLDYESEDYQDFALRRMALHLGGWDFLPGSIRWMPARGVPLVDLTERVTREMQRFHCGVFVCDSVAFACGGDLIKADVATGFYNGLARLPLSTKILIAHTNRIEDDKYPFGSIFWHNGIHGASWFVKAAKDDASVTQGWYLRKNSDGPRPQDFALRFEFDETTIQMVAGNLEILNRELGRQSAKQKIHEILADGKIDAKELSGRLDMAENLVRAHLSKMLKKGEVVKIGREWGLAL